MATKISKPVAVVLPSENQMREFDAKLLLACFLADAGVPVYVGARHEIHANIHQLPRFLYVAKDFRKPSLRIFEIIERLGHEIVAWDEEGMLIFNSDIYYRRRVIERALRLVKEFYAWGEPNKTLIENAPGYPGSPVRVTGNPRIDLLRPELRAFHADAVRQLRNRFGTFILINSSFGSVNHFVPSMSVRPGEYDTRLGHQPAPELSEIWRYRRKVFESFLDLVPNLARRFPDHRIIVRPHPSEDHSAWRQVTYGLNNAEVIHDGSVIPWLLSCKIMVHNGCTTGVEAFLLGRPSINYQPMSSVLGEMDIPAVLSHRACSEDELFEKISGCLQSQQPLPQNSEQWADVRRVLAALDGPLASERVAHHILDYLGREESRKHAVYGKQIIGQFQSRWRKFGKSVNARWPGHKASKAHNLHRYPGLSLADIDKKVRLFAEQLGRFGNVRTRRFREQIYMLEIAP